MALNKQALREINDLKQPVVARVSRRDSQRGCSWNSQTLLSGKHICREFLSCKPGVFISCYLVYFPGVLAGLPFGKLTGERVGFVSVVGLQFS